VGVAAPVRAGGRGIVAQQRGRSGIHRANGKLGHTILHGVLHTWLCTFRQHELTGGSQEAGRLVPVGSGDLFGRAHFPEILRAPGILRRYRHTAVCLLGLDSGTVMARWALA